MCSRPPAGDCGRHDRHDPAPAAYHVDDADGESPLSQIASLPRPARLPKGERCDPHAQDVVVAPQNADERPKDVPIALRTLPRVREAALIEHRTAATVATAVT
jgi:hypothetical protein